MRCADESHGTHWDGQKEKLSLTAELCKRIGFAKEQIVVSLHNFLFILISRLLPNLKQAKLAYTTALRHKRIHNCITQSKASRSTMAANAGNVPQLRAILTSHTIAPSRCCTVHCAPLQQLWIYDSFDDCWFAKHCGISVFIKCQDQRISKTCRSTFHIPQFIKSLRGSIFYI